MTDPGVLAVVIENWGDCCCIGFSSGGNRGHCVVLNQEKAAEKVMAFCHLFNRSKETDAAMFRAVQQGEGRLEAPGLAACGPLTQNYLIMPAKW
jgi:hypothetical protein